MKTVELTNAEREEIIRLHKATGTRIWADRLKAILLLDKGMSCDEVGKILLLDDDTIRTYRKKYNSGGLLELTDYRYRGKPIKLTQAQLTELDDHLQEYVYPTCKEIRVLIKGWFLVNYTESGVRELLLRMGYTYKKPKCVPGKADVEKQEEFVELYDKTKKELGEDDEIYFIDGVHPQHNTVATSGWIKKGQQKLLRTNTGRKRVNINGALEVESKQVIHVQCDSINSQSTIDLLEKLQKHQPIGRIICILDNARYYKSKLLKDYLNNHSRIEFMYLPAYSPNLNVIERLWLILKKNVVYNKYYPKFSEFENAVQSFFEREVWKQKEFENYLIDKFHILNPQFPGSFL